MVKYLLDYYDLLKIEQDADTTAIKKGYKKKLRLCKNNPKKTNYVKDAYIVLTDDKKRTKYDKLLKTADVITEEELFKEEEEKEEAKKVETNNQQNSQKSNMKNTMKSGMKGGMKGGMGGGMGGGRMASSATSNPINMITKLLGAGSTGMKGSSMLSGTNLLLGGATAAYGIKKGRDYMNSKGGGGKNQK